VEIRLTADDYNLLLQYADLSPDPQHALRAGVVDGMVLRFEMSPEVGGELLVDLMNSALDGIDRKRRSTLERLVRALADELGRQGMEFDVDPVGLIRRQNSYNRTPQSDLGGLTPLQVHRLLAGDWKPDSPGLQIQRRVPAEHLAGADFLHHARALLSAVGPDGTRATPAGNLNRAFVNRMVATMRAREEFREEWLERKQVINEQDVWLLHELRLVLELAGLIRKQKGAFRLTRRGRGLLAEKETGALCALLFETTFRRFNLAFRDRLPDLPDFQDTVAYPLAILAREPEGWLPFRSLVPRLLLPSLAVQLSLPMLPQWPEILIQRRFLDHLRRFGLVEIRCDDSPGRYGRGIEQIRRTPLFDHLLHFDLG